MLRINAIKIDQSQLKLTSHLKTPAWKELLLDFEKFSNSLSLSVNKGKQAKKQDCTAKEDTAEKGKGKHTYHFNLKRIKTVKFYFNLNIYVTGSLK